MNDRVPLSGRRSRESGPPEAPHSCSVVRAVALLVCLNGRADIPPPERPFATVAEAVDLFDRLIPDAGKLLESRLAAIIGCHDGGDPESAFHDCCLLLDDPRVVAHRDTMGPPWSSAAGPLRGVSPQYRIPDTLSVSEIDAIKQTRTKRALKWTWKDIPPGDFGRTGWNII